MKPYVIPNPKAVEVCDCNTTESGIKKALCTCTNKGRREKGTNPSPMVRYQKKRARRYYRDPKNW